MVLIVQWACLTVVLGLHSVSAEEGIDPDGCGLWEPEDEWVATTSLLQVGTRHSQSALIRDMPAVHVAYATTLRSSSGLLNSSGLGNVGLLASMLSLSQALTVFERVVIHLIIPTADIGYATDLVNCFMNQFDSADDSRPTVEVHAERPLPFTPGTNHHKSDLSGNTMTFARWFLPEYLPNVSKVLYLDTDTIVQQGVSELFVQDVDVAMRLKLGDDFEPTMKSIEVHYQRDADAWKAWKDVIPKGVQNYSVFNAGVLFANLDLWRTSNVTGRLVDMANSFIAQNAALDDQLILNIVARQSKSVQELPPRFNEEGSGWYPFCDTPSSEAVIIHWSGMYKPWSFLGEQPRGSCNPFDKFLPRRQCISSIVSAKANKLPMIFTHTSADGSRFHESSSANCSIAWAKSIDYGWTCPYMDASSFEIDGVLHVLQKLENLKQLAAKEEARAKRSGDMKTSEVAKKRFDAAVADSENFANGTLRLYNPSLVQLPNSWRKTSEERWLASFHFQTNEGLAADAQYFHGMPTWFSSYITLAVLDENMHLVRPVVVLGPQDVSSKVFDCQSATSDYHNFGPEDPRLLATTSSDEVFVVWSGRKQGALLNTPCATKGGQRMYMSRIGSDLRLQNPSPILVHGDAALALQEVEKNWSPFTYTSNWTGRENTLIEISISPHVVANLSYSNGAPLLGETWNTSSGVVGTWMEKYSSKMISGDRLVHGGVSPIRYQHHGQDVFVSILHTRVNECNAPFVRSDNEKEYKSALYIFEASPPFKILGVSERWLPLMPKRVTWSTKVAFATQLLGPASTQAAEFWVMYGQGDCQSQRLRLNATEFASYLP